MTVGSLFSGIGGLDLGLERAGMTVRWQCENDLYCCAVLARHWPEIQRYGDARTLDAATHETVDLICGGFPCQDVSCAGKGAGLAGERSGLFAELHRIVAALRPRWGVFENVPALRTRGADIVLGSLEALGYACWPLVVGADLVGAPQLSNRLFLVAASESGRRPPEIHCGVGAEAQDETQPERLARLRTRDVSWPPRPESIGPFQMPPDGFPRGLVSFARRNALRALGNAVVPQVAEVIGRAIMKVETGT